MRIIHNQQLGHTWLIILPYAYTKISDMLLFNNNSPFPDQNVVVEQRK